MPSRLCPTCGAREIKNPRAVRCKACANRAKAGTFTRVTGPAVAQEREARAHAWRERWTELAAREMLALALSDDEAAVVRHVVRGTHWDAANVPLLWSEVDEAIRMEGLRRWPFAVDALVARLRALSPLQSLAVVDAFERAP